MTARFRDRFYIDGAWVRPAAGDVVEVSNPTTEEVMGRVPAGRPEDAARAVDAAAAAFEGWAATSREDRAKYLRLIAEGLQARAGEIATLVAEEVGMPVNQAMVIQAGLPIITFSSMPDVLRSLETEERIGTSLVVREPAGVVAAVTPWNYPLHQIAAKVAPALAAGCPVVVKPSELAPLTAFVLADVAHEVELPPGVLNVVTGTGPAVGEALVSHPKVDVVSFTGSTATGRRVAQLAAATVKRVTLELGGKSPSVVLDDADLSRAVPAAVTSAFLNSGQTCLALTRLLIPRSRLGEAEEIAAATAAGYVCGDPLADGTTLGPLVSEAQWRRVQGYLREAVEGGARAVVGGPGRPDGLERGWFARPTVLSGVAPDARVAQEEVFGPVLVLLAYDGEDEAVAVANGTVYGLSAAVWSGDRDRALRVARRLRAGQVDVNGGAFNPLAPFGGVKQSGVGRELGRHGMEEFLEVKSLQL